MGCRLTQEEFIVRASVVHNNRYDYSLCTFLGVVTPITIICPKHGEFTQTPMGHLNGRGCRLCAMESLADSKRLGTDAFIRKASEIHGSKYDYSEVTYTNNLTKVNIICDIHGGFMQTPKNHLSGSGCKYCGFELSSFSGSYTRDVPGILYYVYFPTIGMWKVGVTMLSVSERFSSEKLPYDTIEIIHFDLVKDAYNFEQEILRTFSTLRYTGPKLLRSGSTELLTKDISEYIDNRLKEGV